MKQIPRLWVNAWTRSAGLLRKNCWFHFHSLIIFIVQSINIINEDMFIVRFKRLKNVDKNCFQYHPAISENGGRQQINGKHTAPQLEGRVFDPQPLRELPWSSMSKSVHLNHPGKKRNSGFGQPSAAFTQVKQQQKNNSTKTSKFQYFLQWSSTVKMISAYIFQWTPKNASLQQPVQQL